MLTQPLCGTPNACIMPAIFKFRHKLGTTFGGGMKHLITALMLTTGLVFSGGASAQEKLDKVVKVGSLGDQSGLYQDIGGPGSTVAAQIAIEEFGLRVKGWEMELFSNQPQK